MREVVSGLNRLIDSTTSVQCSDGSIGKPGKGLRFCSACAGARRSTLTPCDQLFTCVLPAYHGSRGSHCPSVCLCLSCTLATLNLSTHRSSSRWSMLSLLRTVPQTGQAICRTVLESSKQQKKFLFTQITLLVVEQQKG